MIRWYWQNLFVCKRFKWTQVWIFDQKAWDAGIKHFNDTEAFIECSNTMDDVMRMLIIITQAEKEKF